jgi:hypothetical protein
MDIEDPCIRNKVIIISCICVGLLSILAILKIADSSRSVWTKKIIDGISLDGKHFLGNKSNTFIIVFGIALIIIPFISRSIVTCDIGPPGSSGEPTVDPNVIAGNIVHVILDGTYTLEEAKNTICNSINKCGNPDELIINSFRIYDTETRLSFRGIAGNITDRDIDYTSNPSIIYTYEENPIIPEVEVSVISFVEFEKNDNLRPIPKLKYPETETETEEIEIVNTPEAIKITLAPTFPPIDPGIPSLTFPPAADPADYIKVCANLDWKDSQDRSCSFYDDQNKCFQYGTDVSNLGLVTNSKCSGFNTQVGCESYKSMINNNMCTWNTNNNTCDSKPISGSDACCLCGGGELDIVLAPTAAPTAIPPVAAPTSAPTSAPTEAPTGAPTEAPTGAPTSAPTSYAESEPILGIKGLVELGSSGYKDWTVPLYIYNLEHYNPGPGSEQYIEEMFFGNIQAPLGEVPKYNNITGKFDGMPNAIVPLEAKDIKTPSGIELKTEPVPGLPGLYYLLIKSPECDNKYLHLYTQPVSQFYPKYVQSYYSKVNPEGNTTNKLNTLGCLRTDYSCICEKGKWEDNGQRYIDYPPIPPALYENCPTASPIPPSSNESEVNIQDELSKTKHPYLSDPNKNKSCKLGADLDLLNIQNTGRNSILFLSEPQPPLDIDTGIGVNIGVMFDNKVLYGYSKTDLSNSCPSEYNACQNNLNCRNSLDQIITDWELLKQSDTSDFVTLMKVFLGGTQIKNSEELYRLKICANKINNQMYDDATQTCDFIKNYYKYCKSSTDRLAGKVRGLGDSITSGAELEDLEISMSEILEFISIIFFEPMCIYSSTQKDNQFWMELFGTNKKNMLKTLFFLIREAALTTDEDEEGGFDIDMNEIMEGCGLNLDDINEILNLDKLDLSAFPLSAGDYAYQNFDPWDDIQKSCCTEYDPTPSPTYKPLPPDAKILCEDTPEELINSLVGGII